MNIHYFQHVPHEGLGIIGNWADRPGNKVTATKFYEDHRLPFIDLFDMLIILGGPMGARDETKFPWMTAEKKMIEAAIKKDKVVLGICLGAQIIADVLGAKVYPNAEKEIGWFPIEFLQAGKERYFQQVENTVDVFHWHGDTFELPSGAKQLARSRACEQQAYSFGNSVLGLQFHLEASKSLVKGFLDAGMDELKPAKYVQSYQEILQAPAQNYERTNSVLLRILEQMVNARQQSVR